MTAIQLELSEPGMAAWLWRWLNEQIEGGGWREAAGEASMSSLQVEGGSQLQDQPACSWLRWC